MLVGDLNRPVIGRFGVSEPNQPGVARRQHSEEAADDTWVLLRLSERQEFFENGTRSFRLASLEQSLSQWQHYLGSQSIIGHLTVSSHTVVRAYPLHLGANRSTISRTGGQR